MISCTKSFLLIFLISFIVGIVKSKDNDYFLFNNKRFKRQLQGQEYDRTKFSCKSGECINIENQCDGIEHCKDGSDETDDCLKIRCPKFLFTCTYGACIDKDLKCDGKQDCRDNSDETSLTCHK